MQGHAARSSCASQQEECMAEGRRKPYVRPAIEHRGRISEETLRSIHGSEEATDPVQPATQDGALHAKERSEPEQR